MTTTTTSRPRRVLLIAPSLEILGGQAVQATLLLATLRREPSVEIEFQPINPRPARPFGWLTRIKFVRTIVTNVIYSVQLIQRVPRADLIHAFSAGKSSYVLWTVPALIVSRLFRKVLIVHYHDGQVEEHLENWIAAESTLRMADAIVSPSDYVVDVLGRHGIRARRIFNIVDPGPFRFRARGRLRPVFLTNRILEPLYNVDCVLRAFGLIQKRYPDATLTVAHDGPCRRQLEQLAVDLGLRRTSFVGKVPHEQIPQLYDSADIYLSTPDFDCMPVSLMECFCSGLPVISTAVGGVPNIVEHERTGLLVGRNDHRALAECAIRLLEDPELVERLTETARAQVESYDEVRIRREWVSLYDEILAPRPNAA